MSCVLCIPAQIVEGNWVVKRAAGTTPAILGTKLRQHHFKGDNYLETDLEIGAFSAIRCTTKLRNKQLQIFGVLCRIPLEVF